ncbi:MAG TPA: STAS domain-containing protein [Actinomycetota bacterium]|jgi:anti-anti-sigma factor|nr:STAS domain-containing protein [Actinomycetota bacterium]
MEIRQSTRRGCLVVAFTGRIDLASVAQVQRALFKGLSEQPEALICDLTGVQSVDPVAATVFSSVARHPANRWPGTSFLLCGARPRVAEVLRPGQVSHLLRLHATVQEALDAVQTRPPHLHTELRLPPTAAAAGAARAFVREVCRAWRLAAPDATVVDRAVLVANELVTNAVIHARTDLWLELELRADRLVVTVRDRGPRLAQPVPLDPEAEGGRGLWLVDQLSRAWGVQPNADGGKVVWCALAL